MRRYAPLCLLLLAGCVDLEAPAKPPVALSVLTGSVQGAADSDPAASAAASVRLLRAVSPTALLTLHLPDLGGAIQRFRKTGLYRWLTSPELRHQLGAADASLLGAFPGFPGDAADWERIVKSLRGEVIFCVDAVDPIAQNPFGVRLLAGVTVPGAEQQAEQLVAFLEMAAAGQEGVHVEKGTVGQYSYSRIVGKRPAPWVAEVALVQDAILGGFGRETVTAALERLQGDEHPSLAEEPSFRGPMERCGDPRDALRLHLAIGTIIERFNPLLPAEVKRVIQALGLDRVRSLAMAVRFEDSDIVVSNLLDSPGGEDSLTQLLAAHTVDPSFVDRLPADTTAFSLFALDGRRVLQGLRNVLAADAREELEAGLATLRRSGVDLETEVFDVFGPRCALVNVPTDRPEGPGLEAIWNQILGTALICEVQDPARAKEILDRLPERGSSATRRAILVEGVPGFAYRFETDQLPEDLAICYTLTDNYLVAATSEEAFKRMLRRRSPQTAVRYRELLKQAPAAAVVVSYDDLRKGPGVFLESILAGLPGAGPLPGEERRLTPQSGVLRTLGPSLSHTVADSRGILTITRSPTGGLGSLGGIGGLLVMAAIAVPNLQHARVESNEAAAIATLRAIHTAEQTFRMNRLRDADGDGAGEFGYLAELLGQPRPGEKQPRSATPLVSGGFQRQEPDHVRGGYRFRVYLPAEDGSPIGEHEKAPRLGRVDGDLSETVMVALAWPVSRGMSGHRSFCIDGEGRVFACLDGPYAEENAPPPDVLCSQQGNLASRPLRETEATRDGHRWVRVR